jgi:mono/diheme cytochrome c family protein
MRYFLAGLALLVVAVLSVAGFRGGASRRPPLELFSDMVRQAKVRPQTPGGFFPDGRLSRLEVPGTIARGAPYQDLPLHTGRVPGTTNFVELNVLPTTAATLARGRERYEISCRPCHGAQGDGKGIATKYGMVVIGNLHDPRIVRLADGELFNTITQGKNLMQAYGPNIVAPDRWAVIAYVRALQLSHLGATNEVPPPDQAALMK